MKFRIFLLFSFILLGAMIFVTACSSNPPTSPASATSTPTHTLTPTVTSTPTPVKFEDFENSTDWGPVGGPPTNSWAMASVAGYNGSTDNFKLSGTAHGGSYSMQFDTVITAAWGYGFFDFETSYASLFGGPLNVKVGGSAPTTLSCWVYSSQATALYFAVYDGTNYSYTNAFTPGQTSVASASTWTHVYVPINSAGGAPWDTGITSIDWTKISNVLIGPNDLTGAANTITVNVDDVYFQ